MHANTFSENQLPKDESGFMTLRSEAPLNTSEDAQFLIDQIYKVSTEDKTSGKKKASEEDKKSGKKKASKEDKKSGKKKASEEDKTSGKKKASKEDKKSGKKKASQKDKKSGKKKASQKDKKEKCYYIRYDNEQILAVYPVAGKYKVKVFNKPDDISSWSLKTNFKTKIIEWQDVSEFRQGKWGCHAFPINIGFEAMNAEYASITNAALIMFQTPFSRDYRFLMMNSVVSILARNIIPLKQDPCPSTRCRAPIFWFQDDTRDIVRNELERFTQILPESRCYPIHAKNNKRIVFQSPIFGPHKYGTRETENSYIQLPTPQRNKVPVQYRDCEVIIDAEKLKHSDCIELIQRNPYATFVFFGSSRKAVRYGGMIDMKFDEFGFEDIENNDIENLSVLLKKFGDYVYQKCNKKWLLNSYPDISQEIDDGLYERSVPKYDMLWTKLQILAYIMLEEYLLITLYDLSIEQEESFKSYGIRYRNEMMDVLANVGKSSAENALHAAKSYSDDECVAVFRKAIADMLKEYEHFPHIPREKDALCLEHPEGNPNLRYYGYRRITGDTHEAVIYFRKAEFKTYFARYAPAECDAFHVLKVCQSREDTALYFKLTKGKVQKDRIPSKRGDSPVASVVLRIENLDFLETDCRETLLKDLEQEKKTITQQAE